MVRAARALAALICLGAAGARPHAAGTRPRPTTGRIEGSVVISSTLAARRPQFRIYTDPGTGSIPPAPPRDPLAAELHNVVIYLEGDTLRQWLDVVYTFDGTQQIGRAHV